VTAQRTDVLVSPSDKEQETSLQEKVEQYIAHHMPWMEIILYREEDGIVLATNQTSYAVFLHTGSCELKELVPQRPRIIKGGIRVLTVHEPFFDFGKFYREHLDPISPAANT